MNGLPRSTIKREQKTKRGYIEPVINDNHLKNADEFELRTGRLMEEQKKQTIQFVHEQKNTQLQLLRRHFCENVIKSELFHISTE